MEKLIKLCEYELDREIINKCIEENRQLKSKDVENEIHEILKDHQIEFKNKIEEKWKAKVGTQKKVNEYCLSVEVYVKQLDYVEAKKLIGEYLK